jgi:hypothetical protein
MSDLRVLIEGMAIAYDTKVEELKTENAKLRAALEPFGRNAKAMSLSATLGHITRKDVERAAALTNEQEGK